MTILRKPPPYLFILFLILISGCRKEEKTEKQSDFLYSQLRDGDIVFRRGTGLASQAVLAADKGGSYSHIGIVVRHQQQWKVVHAVPGEPDYAGDIDRIKMETIVSFFRKERAKTGALMRPAIDSLRCCQAAQHAVRLFEAGIRFDHNYNLNDTSQMYCTELIDYVYKQQGIDLTEGRISRISVPGLSGSYILPSDIQQSDLLNLIYFF